jgi:hypothetical protein
MQFHLYCQGDLLTRRISNKLSGARVVHGGLATDPDSPERGGLQAPGYSV